MLQKVRLRSADGEKEYLLVPDSASYDAGRASGEIAPGMDIVYRQWIAYVLDNGTMIIPAESWANPLRIAPPIPNMGGTPNINWKVVMNGVPVDPSQFTGGTNDA